MENKTIKKEIEDEVNDFIKSVENTPMLTKEQIEKLQLFDKNIKVPFSSTHSEQALRYNQGKLKWSLVDWKSLEPMVRVLEMGASKYAPYNWAKGMPVTEVSESLLRHMFAYLDGENLDSESKIEHLGHVMCNCMFLIHIMREKPEFDDRTIINKKYDNR
jgi:hypothetical protein